MESTITQHLYTQFKPHSDLDFTETRTTTDVILF